MLFSPTAMGITGFNAFPPVIHFSIFRQPAKARPLTRWLRLCMAVGSDIRLRNHLRVAVPCFTENLEYCPEHAGIAETVVDFGLREGSFNGQYSRFSVKQGTATRK